MRITSTFVSVAIALSMAVFCPMDALSQMHPEVLVVYNSNYPDSLTVANHYMAARSVPANNLCAIAPPADDNLNLSDYTTYVKTPIQACLNTVGSKTILYIVMSYLTPYAVYAGPMGVAAVDSYLADIWDKYLTQSIVVTPNLPHPYYADSQSQGNFYLPFQSFATYRANSRNALIYSVWRIDAPTTVLASALVDQAKQAEANGGPFGQACIDESRGDVTLFADGGYATGDWDLHKAAVFLEQAGVTTVDDTNEAEFGTAPAPLTCPDTAFYSGWYSLNNYNDAFTWQTGSVGWHIDSASALSPRSGTSWAPNALLRGIAVTTGSVAEPYLQGLVRPGGTFRNLLEGASVGDAFLRNTRWLKWQIMYIGDPLYKPFGAGRYPFSPLQPVNYFELSPQEIVGGGHSTGTISLSAAAPAGGMTFALNAPSGISVPPTVTVPSGTSKATFTVNTAIASFSQAYAITAANGTLALSNSITTDPLLGELLPESSSTIGGLPVSVTVLLNALAPVGGAVINLSSDNAAATVPATVTVPAGFSSATFNVSSVPVTSSITANITGTYAGYSSQFSIVVQPGM